MPEPKEDTNLLLQIIQTIPIPSFVINAEHQVTHWNEACEVITNIKAEDMLGSTETWRAFYDHERPLLSNLMLNKHIEKLQELYKDKYHSSDYLAGTWQAEDYFPNLIGGGRWLAFSSRLLFDADGEVIGAVEILFDITKQKESQLEVQKSQNLLTEIIQGCPVPLFVLNEEHKITHWNRACENVIGSTSEEMFNTQNQWKAFYPKKRPVLADLVLEGNKEKLSEYYNGLWEESPLIKDAWQATDYFPDFKNGAKWLSFTAAPIHNKGGKIIGAVETLQDITAQKKYEEQLEHQAAHDTLTGLANRSLLRHRLHQAISIAEREERLLALLFIDMDNFKTVNDTLGHSAGDKLICETANCLSECVRSSDTVARIGGDEFVVILFSPDNHERINDVVKRINKKLKHVFSMNGQEFHVSSSIGIAVYPQDGKDVNTLMMNADSAMYQSKRNNKGSFHYFTKDLNSEAKKKVEIENNLHKAIQEKQFELYYQPILDLNTGQIIAAEALIRWNHPEHGIISPMDFIPIAEESDLIVEIGNWVLHMAAKEAFYWAHDLNRHIRLSINVSAKQFNKCDIHNNLQALFKKLNKSKLDIELELTENLVMHNPDEAENSMKNLRQLGVKLAMDDFGTGYSSLAYLRRFPFDMIKIDKAFVKDLGKSREADAIVRTVLQLGKALGLRMLAEGVETYTQRDFLIKEGCNEVQGFLFSKPMNAISFRELLAREAPVVHEIKAASM